MKRQITVLAIGLILGLLDLIPLLLAGAPLYNMLAIVAFWIVAATVMAKTSFVRNSLLDGLIFGVLLMLPLILTVSAVNPGDFLPMLLMAVLLGPLCAWSLKKLGCRDGK